MNRDDAMGVVLECGPKDWQVLQQDAAGEATLRLSGRWVTPRPKDQAVVWTRVVREDGYEAVTAGLDWTPATTTNDGTSGTWKTTLKHVPRGGLYRLETVLQRDGEPIEWAMRGDMVHHFGVGDVWVIAGQSNAAGYGKVPVEDGPELGVHMFAADGAWKLATHPLSDSTRSRYTPNRENANGSHSPWLAFGRRLKQALGYPIGLIPASLGGSAIDSWDPKGSGELFNNMLGYITDSGGKARGVLWYQGESDRSAENRKRYKDRFRRFLTGLRKAVKDPRLPVITVQLNRFVGEDFGTAVHEDWEQVREIQRQLSHELDGVYLFPIFESGISDVIHNNSRGNLMIGQRAALTALGAVYGYDLAWKHPECVRARRVSAKVLELRFENVTGRLNYESRISREFPFAVRDREGDVPIIGYELPRKHVFKILLGRALGPDATVTGAPSAYPPQNVPVDIPGYRSMLGFTLKVT